MRVFQVQYHTATQRKIVVVVLDEPLTTGETTLKEIAIAKAKEVDSGFDKLVQVRTLWGGDVLPVSTRPL